MILLLDNYGSFSYNLLQLAGAIRPDIRIERSDRVTVEQITALSPSHLIISSGSGRPESAGVCLQAVTALKGRLPILGVGLGHQVVCAACGAAIEHAAWPARAWTRDVHIANGDAIFQGLPPVISAACHSALNVIKSSLPDELLVIAEAGEDEVMAVKHRDHHLYGLQFNPESILTPQGCIIMANFLALGGKRND